MKLKRLPEDFRVDEQLALDFARGAGPFTAYRLTKRSLGTLEAIAAVMRHWKLPRARIAFAGLKDKHALTTQYITIHQGPRRGFKQTNLELAPVGRLDRPIHASDIDANNFAVVIRDLTTAEIDRLSLKTQAGPLSFPNYFDDQRFGSLGESGEFIALPWCRGDYERAIWLALTDPNKHDSPRVRAEKTSIRERWGDWSILREQWPDSQNAAVLGHLAAYSGDFRRAIARLPHDLRSLWLAAFQSHLWNRTLAALIRESTANADLTWQIVGGQRLPFFTNVPSLEEDLRLPLPSARLHLSDERLSKLYTKVLSEQGVELRELRVKYPRDSFFSKGEREAVATALVRTEAAPDDLYPDRHKLTLHFSLRRGAYATILLKQILEEVEPADEHDA